MDEFQSSRFDQQIAAALVNVRKVLDVARNPQLPSEVQHKYEDKYSLVTCLTNSALAALLHCFAALGITAEHLKTMKAWSATRSVTLRFSAERRCTFDREVKRDVDSATKRVTESSVLGTFTSKTVTTVTEYFWKFFANWELSAYAGTAVAEGVVFNARKAQHELMTSAKSTPQPEVHVHPANEVNITWFLQQLNADGKFAFEIDRSLASCHTPRRNAAIDRAIQEFNSIFSFSSSVQHYFTGQLFPIQTGHGFDLDSLRKIDSIFVPVVPLFEKGRVKRKAEEEKGVVIHTGPPEDSTCLSLADMGLFLEQQSKSMAEKFEALATAFPPTGALITVQEAKVLVVVYHSQKVVHAHKDSVDYVEMMLYRQLIAAIGKVVTPVDFTEYMAFHARKLFKAEYLPKSFCYAIRRPDHYPEGTISVESTGTAANIPEPIQTVVRMSTAASPMYFSINAATKIAFMGERYLHGCVLHRFSDQGSPNMSLTCRARQFSSFILLVGTILSKDEFKPTYGTIIQNKDELKIPLLLETLPTPKEFADAIVSLSPEQQRFCKAFRSMQLSSTLFGVCIIQIKPQLEKLLRIPNDSLTKEIRLTQDLMELFIKYQVPSDLLSYEGLEDAESVTKVGQVKTNVAALMQMLQDAKNQELKEAAEERVKEVLLEPTCAPMMDYECETMSLGASLDVAMPEMLMAVDTASMPMKQQRGGMSLPRIMQRSARSAPTSAPPPGGPPPSAAPPSAPAPSPVPSQPSKPAEPPKPEPKPAEPAKPAEPPKRPDEQLQPVGAPSEDYTALPVALDGRIAALDSSHGLRSTIIKPAESWVKHYQKGLLSKPTSKSMDDTEQKEDKNAAFDLLDALSRSGVLSIDQASLHVVLMATHCFDKTLVQTVIQDNINPIETVERSLLIVASTIQDAAPLDLVLPEQRERVAQYSPSLLGAE